MKTVLVTGAAGFIGRHTIPHLQKAGFAIHAVDVKKPLEIRPGVVHHTVDLFNQAERRQLLSVVRPTHVLHLAWQVSGNYWVSPENIQWVEASTSLFREFAATGGRRWLGTGSCAEYDWSTAGPLNESCSPLRPASLYGAAKHATHTLLEALGGQMGVSAAWGRLFYLYGPHEPAERLVPSVIRSLLAERPAQCTQGTQKRDFLHVDDIAHGLVTLLDSDWKGAANICSGTPVQVADMVRAIGKIMGRPDLLQIGALPMKAGEPEMISGDPAALRSLGFHPTHSMESGLAATVEWWRKQSSSTGETRS